MENLLFLATKKVFAVYNYKIFQEKEALAEEGQFKISKTLAPLVKEKLKLQCQIDEQQITVSLPVNNYLYEFSVIVKNQGSRFRNLEFMLTNCIKVVRASYSAYSSGIINFLGMEHIIDETIQNSIVALITKRRLTPYFVHPFFERFCELLEKLSKWANRTYEGRKISFSFLIDLEQSKRKPDIFKELNKFLDDDASALVTDGITSYMAISDKLEYKVVEYFNAEESVNDDFPIVPYRFSSFGNMCSKNNLGVILTVQGDILLVKGRQLIYAKRNGEWHKYDYEAFNDCLFNDMETRIVASDEGETLKLKKENREKIKKVYLTCLDVAFARTGGCFSICMPENLENIKKDVDNGDLHLPYAKVEEGKQRSNKRYILEDIIVGQKTFDSLGRKARQELLGIDGATIISMDWDVITTGAIIDNTFEEDIEGRHGGARTKIARKLSQYGIAIKISADGYIECYKNQKHIY